MHTINNPIYTHNPNPHNPSDLLFLLKDDSKLLIMVIDNQKDKLSMSGTSYPDTREILMIINVKSPKITLNHPNP